MILKAHFTTILIVLTMAVLSTPAEGALIRHTFSGTINHVVAGPPPAPWEGAGLGSVWELSYVFDTGLPDQNGDTRIGFYTIDNGSISMDGVELFAVFGEITVNDGLIGFDEYRVLLFNTPLGGGGVSFGAPPGTLESDAIPVDIDLAAWNSTHFEFGGGLAFFFQGNVFTFTSEIVPGSGGWLLIVLGSIVRGGRHRRRFPGGIHGRTNGNFHQKKGCSS